jgi:predicted acetyltransferase
MPLDEMASFTDLSNAAGAIDYDAQYIHPETNHFRDIVDGCKEINFYGAVLDGKVVGRTSVAMLKMNLRSATVKLSGIGMVMTDMLHKKERICKTMLEHFIDESLRDGANIHFLSPFRQDFYKKMGFGYGSTLYQYRFPTVSIPDIGKKSDLSYFTKNDVQAFLNCYNRFYQMHHGSISRIEYFLSNQLGGSKRIVVRRLQNGEISGALVYTCGENREMTVNEMIYNDTETLYAFCSFLCSQADEFTSVIINTPDEYLYYLMNEGTNGLSQIEICKCSVDNMFRISNVAGLFKELHEVNFNDQSITLGINLLDSFLPSNQSKTIVQFEKGYPHVIDDKSITPSLKITMDVSNFSSLMVGAIDVNALCRMGLITLSDSGKQSALEKLFALSSKPLCTQHV